MRKGKGGKPTVVVSMPRGSFSKRHKKKKMVHKGLRSNQMLAKLAEAFASQLINPMEMEEEEKPMVPYPRQQPEQVTMFRLKYMTTIPYGKQLVTSDPRYGYASTIMYPNLTAPLWVWETSESALTGPVSAEIRVRSPFNACVGLPPLGREDIDESLTSNVPEIDTSNWVNIMGLATYTDEQDSYGRPLNLGVDVNGNVFYGIPYAGKEDGTQTAMSFGYSVINSSDMATGTQFDFQIVSRFGTIAHTSTAMPGADNIWSGSFTIAGALTTLGGTFKNATPDNPIGIRMKLVDGGGSGNKTIHPIEVKFTIQFEAGAYIGRYTPKFPNAARSSFDFVDSYNVCAMGELISYEGNSLQDGGTRVGMLYRGGSNVQIDGYTGYDIIGSAIGGVERPLKQGLYQYWKPSDETDMAFRRRVDIIKTYSMPAIINVWKVATPNQLDILRLNAQLIIEAKTQDMTRPTVTPMANPLGVALIFNRVAHLPTVMDNPKHWGIIANFMKKTMKKGQDVAAWYGENKGWIHPALGALSASLAAL